jgi:hypothetical protein
VVTGPVSHTVDTNEAGKGRSVVNHAVPDDERGAEVLRQQGDPPPVVGLHGRPDEHSPIMPDRTWRTGGC